ncbi:cobyric acid synthase [Paracoccaceae bacterium]|nr:cobyric acid synthase [Paracoccaceae bacterium]
MGRALMIQGAGSNVGKSLVVAGLLRAFRNRGLTTCPFKPQNMSNNAAVTADGGEIGRAQALQARAAGVPPHTDMNPVLLKPESETGSQLIVQGKMRGHLSARDFGRKKQDLMPPVLESFQRIARQADVTIVEGAGSPAEINLRRNDIANMGFARAANVPVILLGDIDRGGVIAQLVGTQAVLDADDAEQVVGFAINKFRGDVSLFDTGLTAITKHTGWPSLGVLTWFQDAWKLPAEDALELASHAGGQIKIAVPVLSRIANFDDLDPLTNEADVTVEMIRAGTALPGDADLVLIPGSKSTIADLAYFRTQGWDIDLRAHHRRGGRILGLCGGYQMLGKDIRDPDGIESRQRSVEGLGLLDISTEMRPEKTLALTQATYLPTGDQVMGYEIHIGQTQGPDCERAWLDIAGRPEGAASIDGRIRGCYLHGLFAEDGFRAAFLKDFGAVSTTRYDQGVENVLDALARQLEQQLDLDHILSLAREVA